MIPEIFLILRQQTALDCPTLPHILSFAAILACSTQNLCVAMPGHVLVDPSAPDEQTASSLRNMYARSPTGTYGEPVFLSAERPFARADETNEDTPSFAICSQRFARNVPTWNPPSSVEEVCPPNFMGWTAGVPHLELQFEKFLTPFDMQCWKTRFKTELCS